MMNKQEWKKSDFIFSKQLGFGQFGVVYQAIERQSHQQLAIKIIPKNKVTSQVLYKRLQRQIQIHSRLKHENIVRMYGYFTDLHHVYILLQYCKHGNLSQPIKQLKQKLSQKKIASIAQQLLHAIVYMSNRHVMHRDIKLENILFDQNYNIKLTDLGCCVHTTQSRRTIIGTIQYLCPEMIKEQAYNHGVDLYCLGIVTYELFYFQSPFYDQEQDEIYKNIREGVIIFDDSVRIVPQSAKDFITKLLKSDPKPCPK